LAVERIRDADRTRRKILDAARREFGKHGLQGARVEAIARRARVNKGLIFYYFQSKEELFRVLSEERIASTLPAHDRETERGPFDWPLRLFETREETLDWVRYFVWEGINLDSAAPTELPQADLRRATFRQLVEEARHYQATGALPAHLDPEQLTFFLYVLGVYPYLLPQMAFLITGHLPDDDQFRAKYKQLLHDIADLFAR
jgi:TetR/AcrR family transcriptional regulator